MGKVWDTDLPPNQRLVLLAYADAAEHDGTDIWPGHKRLASMTGYSRTQVERITRDLITAGVLIRVTKAYRGRRARFCIPLDHPAFVSQDATQSESGNVATETESVASEVNEVAPDATRPVLTVPSSSPVLKTAASPLPSDEDYMDLLVDIYGKPLHWSQYQDIVNHIKAHNGHPEDISHKSALLTAEWGAAKATPASLKKWWTRYDAQISQVSDADVEAFTAAGDRAATLERLADE